MAILTQNFRGTRNLSTAYRNTSGYPLIVVAYGTGFDLLTVNTDSSSTPTTRVWGAQGSPINTRGDGAIFVVQPNDYYLFFDGPATINVLEIAVGVGGITASGNLSGSRSLATNYHNTSGGAMLVLVRIGAPASPADLTGYSDNTTTPTAMVWRSHTIASVPDSAAILVPNGHYYRAESASATLASWNEYILPFQVIKTDQTASRALGTAYQNTGSDGMFVSVVRNGSGLVAGTKQFLSDTSNPPTTVEFFQQTSTAGVSESAGFALSNWYYATNTGPEGFTWWEYTIGSLNVGGKLLQCAQP